MKMYFPWGEEALNRTITELREGILCILDIQFGGYCNMACIYCDTPKYNFQCLLDLNAIERIINTGKVQWVYACGLGEPTAKGNVEAFKKILAMCKKMSVKVSIFSNMVNLDDVLLEYISCGTLHVLFKLDSFDRNTMNYLYGCNNADIILSNYKRLKEVVRVNGDTTNLAASIVPTSQNYGELTDIIDWCMENDIYPLLGQLENAGKCSQIFNQLKLEDERLIGLRQYITEKYGVQYEIPVCPATLCGVHITNDNRVIVDERTGLSCGWFWLDEPKMITLGTITEMSFDEVMDTIIKYRSSKFSDVIKLEESLTPNPFGGCGGDAKSLLDKYIGVCKGIY